MISARIDLAKGWGDAFARRIEQQARVELARASEDGARAASQASLSRRRTGRMADVETLPVAPTPRGYTGGFRSKAWYAGFQSRGTLGSRRGKLKSSTLRRRQSATGQARLAKLGGSGGIAPLGFLEKGRAVARKSLIDRLNRL